MAEPKDALKTVKMSTVEVREMAGTAGVHDGRFGENFDDELDFRSIIWVTVSIAVITALGFVIAWGVMVWLAGAQEAAAESPIPVVKQDGARRLPSGPRLQASPEKELEAMREEMHRRLDGYGWVDEAAGVVHVPVDKAMDLVLETGLAAAGGAAEEAPEDQAETGQEANTP